MAWADGNDLTLSGLGTLGAFRINTDAAQFVRDLRQNNGAKKDFDFSVDSRLALQLDYPLDDAFSLTMQALAQKNRDGNFKPEFKWANVKYRFNQAWSFRGGRIGIPMFLISDSRNVGYASPWVRPPVDVYSQGVSSIFDGIDASWSHRFSGHTLRLQPYVGTSSSKLRPNLDVDITRMYGLNSTYEQGAWLFRAGYLHMKLDAESPALNILFKAMHNIGQTAGLDSWARAADALETRAKRATFSGVGM
ncbi:hypothetical protein [Chitinimonas sp. BJB300]|uniref:hypothetical protein n=1 Tax=Chitinimonas sp. BJB300 TaxID=1559339 RepID=UPI000C0DD64A|nr:hypothetical protein [Chitinimonas sp. BJB300]PHV13491.1 hypothetical protein CSQ89_00210 [Chitinimonas sp. BJB300]TSJ89824.1 hypothetical protein FG002_006320 [Chitinimonas sp. BJB300]